MPDPKDLVPAAGKWYGVHSPTDREYRCGFCSADVASDRGWFASDSVKTNANQAAVYICPNCKCPTFIGRELGGDFERGQWPGPLPFERVEGLPADVSALYTEARASVAANAPTGAMMLCRKILMDVAVEKEAPENKGFADYVQWLIDERWAPRSAEGWVDYIRKRGNEANHDIEVMSHADARGVLRFTQELLRAVYELPAAIPQGAAPEAEAEEGVARPPLPPGTARPS